MGTNMCLEPDAHTPWLLYTLVNRCILRQLPGQGRAGQGGTGRGRAGRGEAASPGIVRVEGHCGSVHLSLESVPFKVRADEPRLCRDKLMRTPASGDQQARLGLRPKRSLFVCLLAPSAVNHTAHTCDTEPDLPQLSSRSCSCIQSDIIFLPLHLFWAPQELSFLKEGSHRAHSSISNYKQGIAM